MTGINIPPQLQRGDLLFVMIPAGEKGPRSTGWNLIKNGLKFDDPRLITHLKSGGNYGYYPAPESKIISIDIDNAEAFHQVGGRELVEGTYKYSAWSDLHKYRGIVECPDIPPHWYGHKTSITSEAGPIIELFFPANEEKSGGQVIGPGSLHPNGRIYDPFFDLAPIKAVLWSDILAIIAVLKPEGLETPIPAKPRKGEIDSPNRKLLRDRYSLSLWDHLPSDAYPSGEEIRGTSPFHDSTSKGGNVAINISKGVFYCFRHQIGYEAAGIDAIARGIIECGQDYDDSAFQKHVKELEKDFPEVAKLEKELYFDRKKAQKEVIQSAIYEAEVMKEKDDTPLSSHVLGTTDAGNADRFLKKYKDKFQYSPSEKNWYYWNESIWTVDNSSCVQKAAIEVVKDIYAEAKIYPDESDRKKIASWAMQSEGERRRRDMVTTVSHVLSIPPDQWNNKPNLLNCQNGTLELDTLKFRGFRQDDYLTLKAGVSYDEDAKCPEWTDHLNLIFGSDSKDPKEKENAKSLISAFQLMAGYSLLSGNQSQIFIILNGDGENGKSVTINTLRMILGDYSTHVKAQTLMQQRDPDKARSDLVRLRYKRFVTSAESKRGEKLDVGLIKELSGGEPLVCRDLHKSEIVFDPEFTIWFATNDLPDIGDTSHSIWRRIWLIPFSQTIPKEKKILDYEKKLFETEGSGILNWMIEGLQKYYTTGLIKPEAIQEASSTYQQEEDPLRDFIDCMCIYDKNAWTSVSDLYTTFVYWSKTARGINKPMVKNAFSRDLAKDKTNLTPERKTGGVRGFKGIQLKSVREIINRN